MSNSDSTVEEAREKNTIDRRTFLNVIRRMKISLTSETFWQGVGVLLLDRRTKQTTRAEVFPGIGFYSRPAPGVNAEEIVAYESGAENPYVIATRDEDTRKKVAKLDQNETATFNTVTIVHHKKDGFVEIRAPGGVAIKLPTLADHEALRGAFNAHTHLYAPGPGTPVPTDGPTPVPSVIPVPTPTGTQVLKAQ